MKSLLPILTVIAAGGRMGNAHPIPIRPARPADAAACAAILNGWIDATPWMPRVHPAEEVVRHYRETVLPAQEVLIAGREAAEGFLALDGSLVSALYVASPGKGLGRALLDAAKAMRARLELWTFLANGGARRFYEREGFGEVRRTTGDNEEGLADVLLGWERRGDGG